MRNESWKLRIEDSAQSAPFALVDDLVVVVRTPRSDDFVTVEVGLAQESQLSHARLPGTDVARASRPVPWVMKGWCGEMYVGPQNAVTIDLTGRRFHLTLERIDHSNCAWPWGSYEFLLECETHLQSDRRPS